MGRHSFIQHSKLTNVKGRIDYISNPKRQEHLYATYTTVEDPKYWDYLATQNRLDFAASGTSGKCIEARELIIALPEELQAYDKEKLLEQFVLQFKKTYGVEVVAALHHNKAMTNYHIHLIFSERKMLEQTTVKYATRNMFYDEHGRHVRTKKEILDENGNIRDGCHIIPKGGIYDIRVFRAKEKIFKSRSFTADVKLMYTDFINDLLQDEKNRLTVFERSGPYLATKKIGKNNPKEDAIRSDNAKRQEWNNAVDEALTAGISESKICEIKTEKIQRPIQESIQSSGFQPEKLGQILQKAINILVKLIRTFPKRAHKEPVFDAEVFHRMQEVHQELLHQNQVIASARRRYERAEAASQEASKPKNVFRRSMRLKATKEMANALLEYQIATEEPDRIVKRAGYRNVAAFTNAYEKSCKLLEEMQKDGRMSKAKESVLAKLEQYEKTAKSKSQEKNTTVQGKKHQVTI